MASLSILFFHENFHFFWLGLVGIEGPITSWSKRPSLSKDLFLGLPLSKHLKRRPGSLHLPVFKFGLCLCLLSIFEFSYFCIFVICICAFLYFCIFVRWCGGDFGELPDKCRWRVWFSAHLSQSPWLWTEGAQHPAIFHSFYFWYFFLFF